MRYYLDTEFLEGTQKSFFCKSKPTIDLISIGLVCEDGREYYAISKDFNLKEAWNRYDLKETSPAKKYMGFYEEKVYWIRENVLKPIFSELSRKEDNIDDSVVNINGKEYSEYNFSYRNLKRLIYKYGKANKQIAENIKEFIYAKENVLYNHERCLISDVGDVRSTIDFYGYYCDYDHVCLSWLYGSMSNLPVGFPQYTMDIQQLIDDNRIDKELLLKEVPQVNCHNALQDAIWNKNAYSWIKDKINK